MKRVLIVLAVTLTLAACGSSVKLNDVGVEDKTGSPVQPVNPAGNEGGTAVASRDVQPVAIGAGAATQPGSECCAASGNGSERCAASGNGRRTSGRC